MQLYYEILRSPVKWPDDLELPFECKELVEGLLVKHPNKRLGASSKDYEDEDGELLRKHPFFKDIDWKMVIFFIFFKKFLIPTNPPFNTRRWIKAAARPSFSEVLPRTGAPVHLTSDRQKCPPMLPRRNPAVSPPLLPQWRRNRHST
jgi:serine/threonine protein kinase